MRHLILCLAAVAALSTLSTRVAAGQPMVCNIVVSADRPSVAEQLRHELAHCNGWSHPAPASLTGPQPVPPLVFVRPYRGPMWVMRLSTPQARETCRAITGRPSFACQWFSTD